VRGFDGAAARRHSQRHDSPVMALVIETFCVLLTAPGFILVLAHNRRAINENEDRPPA